MNWLISTALRFRVLVVAAAIALIVVGIRSANDVPFDVFPEFAPPRVEIQTEAPGLSTEEVESLVSVPIENSLNGIPFLDHVRSKSVLGLSSIQLYFQRGTDLLTARQLVQERLAVSASRLAQCCQFSGHSAAAFVVKPRDEDWLVVQDPVADGVNRAVQVDDSTAADGGPRSRQRCHLGRLRQTVPDPRRSRSLASLWHFGQSSDDRRWPVWSIPSRVVFWTHRINGLPCDIPQRSKVSRTCSKRWWRTATAFRCCWGKSPTW